MDFKRLGFVADFSKRAPKSMCTCGHTGDGANSEHEETVQRGHGACKIAGCECERFSWDEYTETFSAAIKKFDKEDA